MKRLLTLLAFTCVSASSFGATLVPIQLVNPAGSTSGQTIVSTGASSAPAWGGIGPSSFAAIAANTVLANATASSASPTAYAMPSCSGNANALTWLSGTGFGCNSAVNASTLGGATFAAPGAIGSTTPGSGSFTTLGASGILTSTNGTQATSSATGAIVTSGGIGVAGNVNSGGTGTFGNGIVGTGTNNNAAAGSVGEYVTNSATSVAMTNGTALNVTSISLTAGDWDVSGTVQILPASTTVLTLVQGGINTTTATLPSTASGLSVVSIAASFTTGGTGWQGALAPTRISIASTTTVFLVASANFSTSTCSAFGFIRARRVR